ncbi:MAG: hypothetical protein ACR2NL_02470 [Acidimicrobiia bacterium]
MTRGKRALLVIGLAIVSGPVLLTIASNSIGRDSLGRIDTGKMLELAAFWVVGFALVLVGVLAWLVVAWAAPDGLGDAEEDSVTSHNHRDDD